ncbi:hypothetical protein Aperf_G00000103457 [Anoplocephala perfoliata]
MQGSQIDELLENQIGGLGAWQFFIIFLTSLSFSNNLLLSVFFNAVPKHRCRADPTVENHLKGWNFTEAALFIGPVDESNNKFRQCERYTVRIPTNITNSSLVIFHENAENLAAPKSTCFEGYVYEYTDDQYKGGIVQQWDLVCDKAWQLPFNENAYMVGMMIGFILGGWLSDRIGRRRAMLISGFSEFAAVVITALSSNHWFYICGRVILAAFVTARGSAYVILTAEITTAKSRSTLAAVGMILQNVIQGSILALLAIYTTSWRAFMILNTSPSILVIIHLCLLPESPRWLAARGRGEDAGRVLYSAYQANTRFCKFRHSHIMTEERFLHQGGIGPDREGEFHVRNLQLRTMLSSNESSNEFSLWRLFAPGLLKITFLSTTILTCQITCILGMTFFASNIKLHVAFVTIVNSIAALCYRYSDSRKLPLLTVYALVVLIGTLAAIHTMHFKPSTDTMLNAYGNIIILLLSSAQRMLFIYVPELYKPLYRNRGFGLAAGLARLGALWFPQINRLDQSVTHGFPLVVYTLISTLQVILLLFLDDTTGHDRNPSMMISLEEHEPSQPARTSN